MRCVHDIQRFESTNIIIMCVYAYLWNITQLNLLMNLHSENNLCLIIASSTFLDVLF
jgi:hypothetical protein